MIGNFLRGLNFYTKPQQYLVSFQVQVKNLTSKENAIDVILPFPLENDYQKLLGNYKITPTSGKLKTETKYQNKYIHWQTILKPNQAIVFKLNFQELVQPRDNSTERTFKHQDYKNLNILPRTKSPRKTVIASDYKNSYNIFLKSDPYLNGNDKRIIKISNDLIKKEQDVIHKIKILNDYVVKKLNYGNPIEGLYTLDQTLKNAAVDCGGFDVLLGSLCLAQKIPVRVVSGFWTGYSENGMHAWLEILLPNGEWISADPSIEQLSSMGRTKKVGRLGFVGSDRIALSLGSNINLKLGNKIINLDILQNPKVLASRGESNFEITTRFEANRL